MKAIVVTDSANFLPRAALAAGYLSRLGYGVTLILSDFDHASKSKISLPGAGDAGAAQTPGIERIYIDTHPYKKNISLGRLYYHYDFARKASRYLERLKPDLIYAVIPGDSIAAMAARIKRDTGAGFIADIVDLWPESLPLKGLSGTYPYRYWRKLRDDALKEADYVLTECGLYREILGLKDERSGVMYWCGDMPGADQGHGSIGASYIAPDIEADSSDPDTVRIAYLGSINNIIDIGSITEILKAVGATRPVRLDIIGGGENKDRFLDALDRAGIEYSYHGPIYDKVGKYEILSCSDWGLNIMKPSVRAGLTMKSIDYMAAGLKLINNLSGDIWELIEEERIGVNVGGDPDEAAREIAGLDFDMKDRIRGIYGARFTSAAAEEALAEAMRVVESG